MSSTEKPLKALLFPNMVSLLALCFGSLRVPCARQRGGSGRGCDAGWAHAGCRCLVSAAPASQRLGTSSSCRRLRLPEAHHAALRIAEEAEPAHLGHFLLLDVNLPARGLDPVAIRGEVVDRDVEEGAGRRGVRFLALELRDAPVDAGLAPGLDDAVVHGAVDVDLPAEKLL